MSKKAKDSINTLPFSQVFSPRVTVDLDHRVLYDNNSNLAIGYIVPTYNIIEIYLRPPLFANENLYDVCLDVKDYFDDKVRFNEKGIIFWGSNHEYIIIGKLGIRNQEADIRLPRVFTRRES